MVTSSLKYMFRPERDGITLSCTATSVSETIRDLPPGSFDLIILDLYLPGEQPVANIETLKMKYPGKPIIIFTTESSIAWEKRMMNLGASAYITKDASREVLKLAIEKVTSGETYFSFRTDHGDPTGMNGDLSLKKSICLTPVQSEILKMIAGGLGHKDIATRMNLSRSTIEKTLNALRKTYGCRSNSQLLAYLIKEGCI